MDDFGGTFREEDKENGEKYEEEGIKKMFLYIC